MFTLRLLTAASLAANISNYDPFHATREERLATSCGPNRSVSSILWLLNGPNGPINGMADVPPEYIVHDEVVMDYWESHEDGVALWTPLTCSKEGDS